MITLCSLMFLMGLAGIITGAFLLNRALGCIVLGLTLIIGSLIGYSSAKKPNQDSHAD